MNIQQILTEQRKFFAEGKTLSPKKRKEALINLRNAIKRYESDICQALYMDLRKDKTESYMTEIGIVLSELNYFIRNIEVLCKPKHVRSPIEQFPSKCYSIPEPYGIVLIMAPWNYPFQLCLVPLIGAIAAGNCAVIKPSAYAPHTSAMVAVLIEEIFNPGYVAVVEGGRQENSLLLEQKFDYIFFTGSSNVGRLVMQKAANYLTPVSLELGGKSPVIIEKSADLMLAAKRIAFGKFINAGQTCVAPDYIFIPEGMENEFINYTIDAIHEFFPDEDYTQMAVIINDKHFSRLYNLIEAEKENIVFGGRSDYQTRFIEPTVLKNINFNSPIMQEEIFGPIMPIITYKDMDKVFDYIRNRPKPLALYAFTNNKAFEKKIIQQLSFGGGCINDTIIHTSVHGLGFGGVGESGMGSYHGKKSFQTFSHYKSIINKSNKVDIETRYMPYTDKKLKTIKKIMK